MLMAHMGGVRKHAILISGHEIFMSFRRQEGFLSIVGIRKVIISVNAIHKQHMEMRVQNAQMMPVLVILTRY
ncbi:hypothetical protein A3195_16535 [Candidatus Thiodiazotropha endoloripes]|nr:hypothetical protein A3194_19300 [Candidatus Thiodiazotropha endoloripes]ODB87136.1 hypothetical protein A3195_16535 [Candidatus Thiodiazotropha endoloripes]